MVVLFLVVSSGADVGWVKRCSEKSVVKSESFNRHESLGLLAAPTRVCRWQSTIRISNHTAGSPLDFARFGQFILDGFKPCRGLEVALLTNRESFKFRSYVINMKERR